MARRRRYEYHGDSVHLSLLSLSDLDAVLALEEVHWLATTAPRSDFLLPADFLDLLDRDRDGRIRVEEVREAIRWLRESTTREHPDDVLRRSDLKREELLAAMDKIGQSFQLDLEQGLALPGLEELYRAFQAEPASRGSGALRPEEVEEEKQRALLRAVQESVRPEKEAVTEEQLDLFLADAARVVEWRGAAPGQDDWSDGFPVYQALEEPLRRYFLLADASSFTGREPQFDWPAEPGDREVKQALKRLPLAYPLRPGGLRFGDRLNPFYRSALERFKETFLEPDETELSRSRYEALKDRFERFAGWLEEAPRSGVKQFSTSQLESWLADTETVLGVRRVLRAKREAGLVSKDFQELRKLLLLQRYLLSFCRNFVAFPDLYDVRSRALFERGTLILDGREFNLSLPVDDLALHRRAAARSNMFVLYVQVEGQTLAVPVTAGSKGLLAVEKRGIFQHVDGSEKEARVIDLVENPISLWEAMLAPFGKIGRALKEKVEELSEEREGELIAESVAVATQRDRRRKPSGTVIAGGGVAVAALGSSLAFILKTLLSLTLPRILLGLFGLFLIFLIPAAAVAFLKLNNRDLSTVLEGNGWGVNSRMKLTTLQARQFTRKPRHPGAPGGVMGKLLAFGLFVFAGCLAYFFRDELARIFSSGV